MTAADPAAARIAPEMGVRRRRKNRKGLRTGDKVDFLLLDTGRVELVPHRASVTALRGMVRHSGPALSLADMDRAVGKGGAS